MIIVPEEGMNVEALQTKYPIINWEVYTEDSRMYWKIIRVEPTKDKERELWVELKRLFEPDDDDILWKLQSRLSKNSLNSKRKLDSTFLVHCRLSHINKKRITKLQHDRLLKLIDNESFNLCVSCISDKMARKNFTHAGKKANELLGLIYIDVCGPFTTTSREVIPKRSRKSTRKDYQSTSSDRGGKYLGQEFLDHLKSCGISNDFSNVLLVLCSRVCYTYTQYGSDKEERSHLTRSKWEHCILQRQDAQPSKNTSEHHPEVDHEDVEPQSDVNLVRRSANIPQVPKQYGFYNDAEEHELGDHGEPTNYRPALSDPESNK
ncbi:retrotransposon protein, putative, ty1-copia subclass [Tanacetum coccineum]